VLHEGSVLRCRGPEDQRTIPANDPVGDVAPRGESAWSSGSCSWRPRMSRPRACGSCTCPGPGTVYLGRNFESAPSVTTCGHRATKPERAFELPLARSVLEGCNQRDEAGDPERGATMTGKKATARKATARKATAKKATAKKATARASSQPGGTPARRAATPSRRASTPTAPGRSGDLIVIDSPQVGSPPREGEVLEVIHGEVSVSYRVRWADGLETLIAPKSGSARIVRASRA